MKKFKGKFSDTVNKFAEEPERTVLRATVHTNEPPKEKHILLLQQYIEASETTEKIQNVITVYILLEERLESTSALVVLHALIVLHRLLKETYKDSFIRVLKDKKVSISLSVDSGSDGTPNQVSFLKSYGLYLESKLNTFRQLKLNVDNKDEADTITVALTGTDESLAKAQILISQLNALVNCVLFVEPEKFSVKSPKTKRKVPVDPLLTEATIQLIKDSNSAYIALSKLILPLLEPFFTKFTLNDCKQVEAAYKSFIKITQELNDFYKQAEAIAPNIKQLEVPKENILELMHDHIEHYNPDELPDVVHLDVSEPEEIPLWQKLPQRVVVFSESSCSSSSSSSYSSSSTCSSPAPITSVTPLPPNITSGNTNKGEKSSTTITLTDLIDNSGKPPSDTTTLAVPTAQRTNDDQIKRPVVKKPQAQKPQVHKAHKGH